MSNKLLKEKNTNARDKMVKSIKNGSIVHWQHINFYGEYDFLDESYKKRAMIDIDAIKSFKIIL